MSDPIFSITALLAQTKTFSPKLVLIWVGAGIVFAVILGMIAVALRKKLFDKYSASDIRGSLMDHLRDAHARGEITNEEYEQTRKSMASRMSHVLDTKRAGGLFELPDPKRPSKRPASRFGAPFKPADPNPVAPSLPDPDGLRAPPGYDLTGQPLPSPADPE